jgi:acyl dehydratase
MGPEDFSFDRIVVGQVHVFGSHRLIASDIQDFHARFAPHLPLLNEAASEATRKGPPAAQALIFAIWSRLLYEECHDWPIIARLGQDTIRWFKTVHADDILSVRLTFLKKEPMGPDRGKVTIQHEILNRDAELVASLVTQTVMAASGQSRRA